jgi:pimeloyl-ACP methyl ester carboxylesterase
MVIVLILAVLAVLGLASNTALQAASRTKPPGTLVDAGGYSLHVDCRGHGSPTVVFESGSGGTSLDWAAVQPEVAKTTRTCSYDRAGFGWSDAASTHTLDRMRHDFDVVLRQAGDGPYVLVAHSFGGLLALDYASRHPDRVAGFVFVDAADKATYEDMNREFPDFFRNGKKAERIVRIGSVATRFGLTRLLNQPAIPKTVVPSVAKMYRSIGFSPKPYRTFADDLRAFPGYVSAAVDNAPKVPAEVLTHNDPGTLWRGVPSEAAERLWQTHQRALALRFGTTNHILQSTHFIQVIQPGAVVAAIERVIGGVRA